MKLKSERPDGLGYLLKNSREKAGLTQSKVAQLLGYKSPQFISNWERGLSSPPGNVLRKLADHYNIAAKKLYEILLAEETAILKRRLSEDILGKPQKTSTKRRRA